jgi:hypothetical protein
MLRLIAEYGGVQQRKADKRSAASTTTPTFRNQYV